jgi:hypothetical protein
VVFVCSTCHTYRSNSRAYRSSSRTASGSNGSMHFTLPWLVRCVDMGAAGHPTPSC